jgi:hypothetical protein
MHEKHATEGLAVVTVDLDDGDDQETRDKVIKFLQQNKAVFTNLVLAPGEKAEDWFDKLGLANGLPHVRVYGRDGKLVQKFDGGDEETHDAIDKLVLDLLQKK